MLNGIYGVMKNDSKYAYFYSFFYFKYSMAFLPKKTFYLKERG